MSNFEYFLYIKNKRALFDYKVEKTYIAGICLSGCEVKSVKLKKVDLTGSYINITSKLEAFINGLTIQPYKQSSLFFSADSGLQPNRQRKLLLKKSEIAKIHSEVVKDRKTIVPLSLFYNKKHLVKLEIAIVSSLKKYDKRVQIKQKDLKRIEKREGKFV